MNEGDEVFGNDICTNIKQFDLLFIVNGSIQRWFSCIMILNISLYLFFKVIV